MLSVNPQLRHPNGATESQSPALTELVAALEDAAQTARHLSSADPCHLPIAYATLRNVHLQIGSFLTQFDSAGDAMKDETMAMEEVLEKVEGGMRDCTLRQSKRCKRPLSPSWAAAQQRLAEDGAREVSSYDPRDRQRSLDLVFQFHA